MIDETVVKVGKSFIDADDGCIVKNAFVENCRVGLFCNDDGERSTLELKLWYNISKPDVKMCCAITVRHEQGDSLSGSTLTRRPTSVLHRQVGFPVSDFKIWIVVADVIVFEAGCDAELAWRSVVTLSASKLLLEAILSRKIDWKHRLKSLRVLCLV